MRRADAEMRNAIALRVNNSRIRVRRRVAGVAAVAAVAATPPTVYLQQIFQFVIIIIMFIMYSNDVLSCIIISLPSDSQT